ncbi:hypothetical protein TNIN_34711 [Trichonephila inaurata madagascariensis]|uniref:Uncharacterized protein n=1 Tax=Trichonephila inaurata madagascariensis TaxID=2747483 RepID=A0A8X7CJV5_9ARAC|nr:hypothetical protein TNIN_34711 [Trichonephila inaurata madagascariensis]
MTTRLGVLSWNGCSTVKAQVLQNGNILMEEEIQVTELRFITKEEAQSERPEGIRLIFTNATVNEYNHSILNSEENKTISLASDVFVGCHNA